MGHKKKQGNREREQTRGIIFSQHLCLVTPVLPFRADNECTLSDKISADKTAENVTCCRKLCPPKIFVHRKFLSTENYVHRKFLPTENFGQVVAFSFVHPGRCSFNFFRSSWSLLFQFLSFILVVALSISFVHPGRCSFNLFRSSWSLLFQSLSFILVVALSISSVHPGRCSFNFFRSSWSI